MGLKSSFKSIRNQIDFYLRSNVKWGWEIPSTVPISAREAKLQTELKGFLQGFAWERHLQRFGRNRLTFVDVGARNFCIAPVVEDLFNKYSLEVDIHGVEVDAYRRMSNFHTRADYGKYYANLVRRGYFHAQDFLNWNTPTHIAFLLNPFVTEEPLLKWGLPRSKLNPRSVFSHCYELLAPQQGLLLLSSPCEEEQEIATQLAREVGFKDLEQHDWRPDSHSIQKQDRMGHLYST